MSNHCSWMFKIPNCSEKAACCHFQPLFVGRPSTVSRKPQTTSHSSHARTVRTTKSTVQVSNELVPTNYWHSISETRKKPKERYQSKSKKKHQKNAPPKKNFGVKSWNAQLEALFVESKGQLWQLLCDLRLQFGDLQATWKFTSENLPEVPRSTVSTVRGQPNGGSVFPTFPGNLRGWHWGGQTFDFPWYMIWRNHNI